MNYEFSIRKRLKILIPIFIILSISIYVIESQLYLIGKNKIRVYNVLPFNLKTERSEYINELNSFGIWEANGMSSIVKGIPYNRIPLKRIIRYGFNDTMLVAFLEDDSNSTYYEKLFPSVNPNFQYAINSFPKISKNDSLSLKWVDINPTNDMTKLEITSSYLLLFWLILAPIIFYNFLFIYTKTK